ncbi:MAG: hypothetical protein QOJ42_1936 [Acidobacteriaceae bacterium]|jgi:CheY-like chemotaxis protein|nr:hypothetical protein [Acidobacteriaceae bacterium]MDX6459103.1 hypothetical protein [Acidobacteriaceae bacterium]
MASATILLVDDDEALRQTLAAVLQEHGYDVTTAGSVPEALKLITAGSYDVLLSDLHMPGRGDGLTVVSAMRHANPKAVTILLSAFPEMDAAAQAILLQTDQILVKPMNIPALIEAIEQRLAIGPPPSRVIQSVATILESSIQRIVDACKPLGCKELVSVPAEQHGRLRCQQGYSAAMMVEESRMLQVSIFETLQKNLASIDFSILLNSVMTIADEVDSQLSQAMDSYMEESLLQATPA